MDIASFQKVSLQDYPGLISAICFTRGCNLRCPYCHNPDLVLFDIDRDESQNKHKEFIEYITLRKNMLEGVTVSGGEPLIHKDLVDLIYQIKNLNLKVKLDTNGMFPNRLKFLLDKNLIDYIALDYKGSSQSLNKAVGLNENINLLSKPWLKSFEIIIKSGVDYELRTTVVKGIHSNEDLILMARELKNSLTKPVSKWFLQSFEEQTDVLGKFTRNLIPLSSYSKAELTKIKEKTKEIVPEVNLRI
ncbi:MAG: anaerobic ribonucleoside-triphosphate reductase activating protein [Clostridium sp.]|nr:anaerobic ribonucleoside-triphosphate reductase activating protein [Clostridium sp.]